MSLAVTSVGFERSANRVRQSLRLAGFLQPPNPVATKHFPNAPDVMSADHNRQMRRLLLSNRVLQGAVEPQLA
ncbi:MAG TPA: hypothetical protein QF564_03295 [Pirellulaceae bacterium]|nr:hypothetical protein [Pirellulaceae bacterium]